MTVTHTFLFYLHILSGSLALVLFWVPVVSRKGSRDHRQYGRHYSKAMYAVAATGALMAALVLWQPLTIKGHQLSNPEHTEQFVTQVRMFWSFLLYLSLITFVSVRHGLAVLKLPHTELKRPGYLAPLMLLLVSAIGLLVMGILANKVLFMVFAGLGMALSTGMLRYCLRTDTTRTLIIIEHLGAMVGSGIGAHTAFIAFGARHLISGLGEWQFIFWILPGVIGGIAISRMAQRYRHADKPLS